MNMSFEARELWKREIARDGDEASFADFSGDLFSAWASGPITI